MKSSFGFVFFLGIRNFYSFRKGRKRSMIGAAIAIALSLIPLIVVIEVSDGMIEGITRRFIELETGHVQLYPYDSLDVDVLEDVSSRIMELPDVDYAAPVYRGTALIYSKSFKTGIQIKALPGDIIQNDAGFRKYLEIKSGKFDMDDPSGIMLSQEIADQLKVDTGEKVKLLTAKTMANGKIILRPESFTVKGIFSTGYYEVDALSGYINLDKGEKIFRDEGFLSVMCKIKDPYNSAEKTASEIRLASGIDASSITWYKLQSSMYESLYTTRILLIFIMAIIVVVAVFNITSSMIIMVIERQQDIAILKSCGTSGVQIRRSFLVTGLISGASGAAAGTIAGLIISVNVNRIISVFHAFSGWVSSIFTGVNDGFSLLSASSYYLEEIPIMIDPWKIIIVAVFSVILSVTAAVIPARKAEKMTPIEIMRKH